ncbi:hypothetical protein EHS25_006507 [Saitozyma podzolica]|uniref:Cytochrome P450-dit2 n=1 Tax=Saitozyma podzolica TaxID=1890683 RepID=A0A427YRV4_9TREE|nr:hypothetical protein EHS25_006507 [Saitozyma podzolica]
MSGPLEHVRLPTAREGILFLIAYLAVRALHYFLYKPLTSPLRNLQHPPGGKGWLGHFSEVIDLYSQEKIDGWVNTYGKAFMVRGPFWVHHRLWTIDPRALAHIMGNPNDYRKSEMLRRAARRYLSSGLIDAEGERHKVQRKVVQRLFSRNSMKLFGKVTQEKTDQLAGIMSDLCSDAEMVCPYAEQPGSEKDTGVREVDIYGLTSRWTYDLIGQVTIDHKFDSLGDWDDGSRDGRDQGELGLFWPRIDKVMPTENSRRVAAGMGPLEELSKKAIRDRRKEIAEGTMDKLADLRVNMSEETLPGQKMWDDEITGQLATFMFAGSETTSGTISWALHALACRPQMQTKLRTECLAYGESLPFEQLDQLPYLDAVVMEVLRVYPSLPSTIREAQKDDIIPLAEPIQDRNGKTVSSIRIRRGQVIYVPIEQLQVATCVWGPDAREFNPERWLNTGASQATPDGAAPESAPASSKRPTGVPDGPGVWPNILTFIDGPRRCVGYKLALMQIKMILYALIRDFEFAPAPEKQIYKWNLTRPYVAGELLSKGTGLPLFVRPYKGDV